MEAYNLKMEAREKAFLESDITEGERELFLKCRNLAQPYIEKMTALPYDLEAVALYAAR